MANRREALARIGKTCAVLGGSALATKLAFDAGGFALSNPLGERQVRDFQVKSPGPEPVMAIAKSSTDPALLVRRAVR